MKIRVTSEAGKQSQCFSTENIQYILQLMGCKPWETSEMADQVMDALNQTSCKGEDHIIECEFSTLKDTIVDIILKNGRARLEEAVLCRDITAATRIFSREQSVTILLCGTSGCGKSTLASLLASRFGITTILSTDHIRHLLRNFYSKETHPILYSSSYNSGLLLLDDHSESSCQQESLIIRGYEAQSELVMHNLERMIAIYEARHESLIIEGVHLTVAATAQLMSKFPTVIPFVIYINNKAKHEERFAIRAKYMTLEPAANKYVQHFSNIRLIQSYILRQADIFHIPKIDNNNVDKSLAIIHRILFNVLSDDDWKMNTSDRLFREYLAAEEKSLRSMETLDLIRLKILKKNAISDLGENFSSSGKLPKSQSFTLSQGKKKSEYSESVELYISDDPSLGS